MKSNINPKKERSPRDSLSDLLLSDSEDKAYKLGDKALESASDIYKNSGLRRAVRAVFIPIDMYAQFNKAVDNYHTNIKDGRSIPAAVSGAASAWAAETGTATVGDFLIGTGVTTIDPPALALGTALTLEAEKIGEKANVTVARLVDNGINKMGALYAYAMNFIAECASKLNSGTIKDFNTIEAAMFSLGYYDYIKSLYSELDANQRFIFNSISKDLFDEHFKLLDSHRLVCMKQPGKVVKPTIEKVTADLRNIKNSASESLKTKQTELNKTFPELVQASKSTIKQISDTNASALASNISPAMKEQIKSMAEKSFFTGKILSDVAYGAILAGGHPRTCQGIAKVGGDLMNLSQNLTLIKGASSYTSLAAFTGYMGIAVSGFSLVMNMLGGNSEENGLQCILESIQALHQAMLSGFRNLEKLITQNMAVVLTRLTRIIDELNRIENLLSVSFKELHLKELEDVIDKLKKDLAGEIKLSDTQKKECLIQLSTWIDIHSKAKIQTSVLRDSKDASKPVAILSDDNFDIMAMFPFLMLQLSHVLPAKLLKDLKMDNLSNLAILSTACDALMTAQSQYQLEDNFIPTLERAKHQFIQVKTILESINNNDEIWDVLFRQYDDIRYQIGRAIYKCRQEFTTKPGVSFEKHLKTGINTENLMHLLDQLELRRLLLLKLCHLTDVSPDIQNKALQLESKENILIRPAEVYDKQANQILDFASQLNYPEFKKSLEYGANVNQWNSWGQAIHYIGRDAYKNTKYSTYLMHELFKSGEELHCCNPANALLKERQEYGTKSAYGTWGAQVLPITWLMNCGHFHLGLLYCAAGYDIVLDHDHFMNGLYWSTKDKWSHWVQYYLVMDMNSESSFLNKKELRKAYQFYKDIEAGLYPSVDNINHDCVLWLVCVLGDLKPLQALGNLKIEINKALPSSGFTPLMMAVNCGHENVIEYLLNKGANIHAQGGFTFSTDDNPNHMINIALKRENWGAANLLASKGTPVTATEREKIDRGMQQKNKSIATVDSTHKLTATTKMSKLIDEEIIKIGTSISLSKSQEVIRTYASQKKEQLTDEHKGLLACYEQCKKIRQIFISKFIKKLELEQMEYSSMIHDELKTFDDLTNKIDSQMQNIKEVLPLMKNLSASLNLIDITLKSALEHEYTLANNIDRILTQFSEEISKKDIPLPSHRAHQSVSPHIAYSILNQKATLQDRICENATQPSR